jgi:hypothetical protein
MAPTAIRERRRTLRYRNLLVHQMVQMKIKISSLLMEAGVSYNKQRPCPGTPASAIQSTRFAPQKAVRSADSALQAEGLRGGRKHRVTPLTSRTPISLSPARPLSTLPTSIQSPTMASPLPCAIELNFSNVQHTHPASATERACDDSPQFSWFSLVFPVRVAISTAS